MRALSATLLLSCLVSGSAFAQQRESYHKEPVSADRRKNVIVSCPRAYIGLSTGFNNPTGILGFSFDVPVATQFSVGAGIGLSTWGTKVFGEGRFYFNDNCHRGWALGLGVSHSTGGSGVEINVEDQYGYTNTAVLDLESKTNAFISGYRIWSLGRRKVNRFHIQLGYSIPFSETEYHVTNGILLSATSDKAIRAIAPGGIVLGAGFSFRLF